MKKLFIYDFTNDQIPSRVLESAHHVDGQIVYSENKLENWRHVGTTTVDGLADWLSSQETERIEAAEAAHFGSDC